MSGQVVFLQTLPPHERIFILKDYETLKQMDPKSEEIQSKNILTEYEKHSKTFEMCSVADFASTLNVIYSRNNVLKILLKTVLMMTHFILK